VVAKTKIFLSHSDLQIPYTKNSFENLLVSEGIYVSPTMYSPDGESVNGSLNDYFRKMSSGNLTISGAVVNNVVDNIPVWISLPGAKTTYAGGSTSTFVTDALTEATAHGLNVSGLDSNVKLVIIYAGNIHFNDALNPAANDIPGTIYIMSERNGSPNSVENSTDVFGRIGTHCHEFAHLLGIGHSTGSRADLMDAGRRNGPNSGGSNGASPAPLNPIARMVKGWVTPTLISSDEQFDAHYSLITPQVFRINSNASSDFFLIENRRFDQ